MRLATSQLRFWGTWRYMQNLKRWFDRNAVDVAYVSMLKHDAYVVAREGKHLGFPVVLRPEGAGATGDVDWQSWGNFGRKIGLACRLADAIVSISTSVEAEVRESLRSGTMRPGRQAGKLDPGAREPRIVSISNGVPVPESAWRHQVRLGQCRRARFSLAVWPQKKG